MTNIYIIRIISCISNDTTTHFRLEYKLQTSAKSKTGYQTRGLMVDSQERHIKQYSSKNTSNNRTKIIY